VVVVIVSLIKFCITYLTVPLNTTLPARRISQTIAMTKFTSVKLYTGKNSNVIGESQNALERLF
jgi:hypothetical protein